MARITLTDPKTLWNTYIQMTEVEDAFRTELKILLQRMKLLLPNRPKIIKNVVAKIG